MISTEAVSILLAGIYSPLCLGDVSLLTLFQQREKPLFSLQEMLEGESERSKKNTKRLERK